MISKGLTRVLFQSAYLLNRIVPDGLLKVGIKDSTEPIVIITVFYIKDEQGETNARN